MSRIIKFRGLSDIQRGATKWVYGDLTTDNFDCAYKETHPDRIHWRVGSAQHNAPIQKGTRGQYTGLKSLGGTEIYEGDVVYLAGYGLYEVEFPFIELYEAAAEQDIGAILGNALENPELLEATNE